MLCMYVCVCNTVFAHANHEDEVRHGRRVDRAARTGAHDQRDLRDHAGRFHVPEKHIRVSTERVHAFLDSNAPDREI